MKVFISTTSFAQFNSKPLDILKGNKIDFTFNPLKRTLSEEEIGNFLAEGSYSGLIAGTEPLTKAVFIKAKSLKVISRVGTGMDNIDLAETKKLNIKVYNTPDVLVDAVAELTIGLTLNVLRQISLMDRKIRNKTWKKEMGLLFKGKILGVIGFGRIGKRVSELAVAFGAEVIFYDLREIKIENALQVSLNKLVQDADIISIHSSTRDKLISKEEIENMKNGVVIINTSRGSVIDEEALYNALKSGKVFSAGLDVFNNEPYSGKLIELDNCILTPHVGSYAKEARIQMEIEAVNNLIKANNLK